MSLPTPAPDRTAIVTGASSGIGTEIARELARRGHGLVLVARRADRLEDLAAELADRGVRIEIAPTDLTDRHARAGLPALVEGLGLEVDLLVNNAGLSTTGAVHRADPDAEANMVELDVLAVTDLCTRFLPSMVERGRGAVLNVASTAAFQPGPFMAVYFATKAYVLSFSEALAEELRHTGVTVTTLCPGPTVTGFQKRAGMEHAPIGGRMVTGDAAAVARAGYAGMMKGRRLVIPGLVNRVGTTLPRFLPRALATRIVARMTAVRGDA